MNKANKIRNSAFFPKSSVTRYNSILLKNVNANGQLIFWKNFWILSCAHLNLIDVSYYRRAKNYIIFLLVNYFRRKKVKITEPVIWINDGWNRNYYHWMLESLPKILSTNLSDKATVLLPSILQEHSFVADSLTALHIKYRYFDYQKERVKCRELYLVLNAARIGTSNPVYINMLREKLTLGLVKRQKSKRIFVSRAKAWARNLVNEDKLISLLSKYNFEVVHFEDLSFLEQVSIAANAEMICGLHGAGLSNMMFMPKGSTVLEITRQEEKNDCFKNLALAAQHRYYRHPTRRLGEDQNNSDFELDLDSFKDFLTNNVKLQ